MTNTMEIKMNTGRRTYFTEAERAAYAQFVSDNGGVEGARKKLKMEWHTVKKHMEDGYCAPNVKKALDRKIFKQVA